MEKCDHAAIFFNIAGNVSQLCLLAMQRGRIITLTAIWTLAALGTAYVFMMGRKSVWHKVVCGSVVLLAIPELVLRLSHRDLALLALTYVPTAMGLLVYALRWPDPKPDLFGYHELMHALVCTGAVFSMFFQYSLLTSFDPAYCLLSSYSSPTHSEVWNVITSVDLYSVAIILKPMIETTQLRILGKIDNWLISSFPSV
jgi:predicted membrane channel-forming protein YqfA (hemolysin III family)